MQSLRKVTRWCSTVLILLGLFAVVDANAMSFAEVDGNLYASGEIVASDLVAFKNAFMSPSIRQVVLVNSPGGDADVGLAVGQLIQEHGYSTVVAGQCVSACAVMFMGGSQRRFADTFHPALTLIGIHGTYEIEAITKQIKFSWEAEKVTRREEAFFREQMGSRFNENLIKKALYGMDDENALLVVPDFIREPKASVYFCRNGRTERKNCTDGLKEDALSMGVITSRDIRAIDLPASIQKVVDDAAKAESKPGSKARTGIELATKDELLSCIEANDALQKSEIDHQAAMDATEIEKTNLETEFADITAAQKKLDTRDKAKVAAFNARSNKYNASVKRLNERIAGFNATAITTNKMAAKYNESCGKSVYAPEDYADALNEFNTREKRTTAIH